MTKPLSPAAQAVFDAVWREIDYAPELHVRWAAIAALRAAADQVAPKPPKNWELIFCVSARELEIRNQLLAIAAELEGQS